MKCMECGADLYEGIKKCPYCKTPTEDAGNGRDFDIKYTISSEEALKTISKSVLGEKSTEQKKKKSVFPEIRRIQKDDGFKSFKADEKKDFNAEEKARELAKSASRRAAEFVPEGMARYTIRGAEYVESQNSAPNYAKNQINEYKHVTKASKPKFQRQKVIQKRED